MSRFHVVIYNVHGHADAVSAVGEWLSVCKYRLLATFSDLTAV